MNTAAKRSVFNGIFKTGSYGASGECHCGVFHYDTANAWDDDHEESVLPQAEEAAKTDPARYQFHDSAIEYVDLNGRLYVIGCRCGMDNFMFDFLNEDKQQVLTYYRDSRDELRVEDVE